MVFADLHAMNHFRSLLSRTVLASLLLAFISASPLQASPGEEMADAANNWLNALSPEQQAKASYAFENDERFDWHFIPKPRKGLPFQEMSPAQQKLAHALLSSGLSLRGYAKRSEERR